MPEPSFFCGGGSMALNSPLSAPEGKMSYPFAKWSQMWPWWELTGAQDGYPGNPGQSNEQIFCEHLPGARN